MDSKVRIQKENVRARGTHFLESADGRSSQDTEINERARGTHKLEITGQGTRWGTERQRREMGSQKQESGIRVEDTGGRLTEC